jgi:hypothetical protein
VGQLGGVALAVLEDFAEMVFHEFADPHGLFLSAVAHSVTLRPIECRLEWIIVRCEGVKVTVSVHGTQIPADHFSIANGHREIDLKPAQLWVSVVAIDRIK